MMAASPGSAETSEAVDDQPPSGENAYRVSLDVFEGPLDLLLYLIRKEQVSIYDIPIGRITEQYLETLKLIQELNLDLAGEFLVMAATLLHIKSRLLLPSPPAEEGAESGVDPRAELVQALLEYQRFRLAAEQLATRPLLGRDEFVRGGLGQDPLGDEGEPRVAAGIVDLVTAFRDLLGRLVGTDAHQVFLESISLADRISQVLDMLPAEGSLLFEDLFRAFLSEAKPGTERYELVVTFLSILELVRIRVVRATQERAFGPIRLERSVALDAGEEARVASEIARIEDYED
jgi:segregation and condensation protein A